MSTLILTKSSKTVPNLKNTWHIYDGGITTIEFEGSDQIKSNKLISRITFEICQEIINGVKLYSS